MELMPPSTMVLLAPSACSFCLVAIHRIARQTVTRVTTISTTRFSVMRPAIDLNMRGEPVQQGKPGWTFPRLNCDMLKQSLLALERGGQLGSLTGFWLKQSGIVVNSQSYQIVRGGETQPGTAGSGPHWLTNGEPDLHGWRPEVKVLWSAHSGALVRRA